MSQTPIILLAMDGAGIRGLLPLRFLESIQQRMKQRGTDFVAHKQFDLICGSSLSSLIAAGLAAPRPGSQIQEAAASISELRQFFERDAHELLKPSLERRLIRQFTNRFGVFDFTHNDRPFEAVLKKWFGWTSLASALTHLAIPVYDIEKRRSVVLGNGRLSDGSRADDYYVWQSVRAGFSTPSLFEPARTENLTRNREETFVDGSLYASHTALLAYAAACDLGWIDREIFIISLGSGHAEEKSFAYEQARNWSSLNWLHPAKGMPLLSISSDGQQQIGTEEGRHVFRALPNVRYLRVDGVIPETCESFDNARPGNIRDLNAAADRIIRDHTLLLDEIAETLIMKTTLRQNQVLEPQFTKSVGT